MRTKKKKRQDNGNDNDKCLDSNAGHDTQTDTDGMRMGRRTWTWTWTEIAHVKATGPQIRTGPVQRSHRATGTVLIVQLMAVKLSSSLSFLLLTHLSNATAAISTPLAASNSHQIAEAKAGALNQGGIRGPIAAYS
ncbi:hypothetical protein ACLKA6_014744 [Drosophila palustris]